MLISLVATTTDKLNISKRKRRYAPRVVMYKTSLLKALGIGHIVRDLAGAVVVFLKFFIEANDDL
jgi:hypothetical protein